MRAEVANVVQVVAVVRAEIETCNKIKLTILYTKTYVIYIFLADPSLPGRAEPCWLQCVPDEQGSLHQFNFILHVLRRWVIYTNNYYIYSNNICPLSQITPPTGTTFTTAWMAFSAAIWTPFVCRRVHSVRPAVATPASAASVAHRGTTFLPVRAEGTSRCAMVPRNPRGRWASARPAWCAMPTVTRFVWPSRLDKQSHVI